MSVDCALQVHATAAAVYTGEPPLRFWFWLRMALCAALTYLVGVRSCRHAELNSTILRPTRTRRQQYRTRAPHQDDGAEIELQQV